MKRMESRTKRWWGCILAGAGFMLSCLSIALFEHLILREVLAAVGLAGIITGISLISSAARQDRGDGGNWTPVSVWGSLAYTSAVVLLIRLWKWLNGTAQLAWGILLAAITVVGLWLEYGKKK